MSDFSPEIQLDKQIKTDEHVRHVTIRQIIGAERKHDSAPWKIECCEVSALMIVANILDCTRNKDGFLDFSLDDGTGRIKCSMKSQKSGEQFFSHFSYVRVVGTISQSRSREKKYFSASGLAGVIDPHEIFYHSMMAIEHSLLVQKSIEQSENRTEHKNALDLENVQEGPSLGSGTSDSHQGDVLYHESIKDSDSEALIQEIVNDFHGPQQTPTAARRHDESERQGDRWPSASQTRTVSSSSTASYHTAYSRRSASPELQPGYGRNQEIAPLEMSTNSFSRQRSRTRIRDPYEHLTIFQRDIILCISNAVEDMDMYTCSKQVDGVHIRDIVRGLRTKYIARLNEREIGEAIEYLLKEGYIYTSIDDEHYAITP